MSRSPLLYVGLVGAVVASLYALFSYGSKTFLKPASLAQLISHLSAFSFLQIVFVVFCAVLGFRSVTSWVAGVRKSHEKASRMAARDYSEALRKQRERQEQQLREASLAAKAAADAQALEIHRQKLAAAEALKAEAEAEAASRKPGGGAVRASEEGLHASIERQELKLREEAARHAAASDVVGDGPRGGEEDVRHSPSSARPVRPAQNLPQRQMDPGPVFPGDELRGWVSPASQEASRLRVQQDAALARSLKKDQAKEQLRQAKEQEQQEAEERKRARKLAAEERRAILLSLLPDEPSSSDGVRILVAVRLPDSSVKKRFWSASACVGDLYNWVESMEFATLKRFNLVKPFPREPISREHFSEISFHEAGIDSNCLLVVEMLE